MTLSDLWPRFQGHNIFWSRISENRHVLKTVTIAQEETIPNMEWYYVWWPWLTSKLVARVCQHQLSFLFCLSYSKSGEPFIWGDILWTSIVSWFMGRFWFCFQHFFSEWIALSDALEVAYFHRQMLPQYSRNCGQKLLKVQKSAEKSVCTTLYR